LEVVKYLIEQDADINARTYDGYGPSPLNIAKYDYGVEHPVYLYLLSSGAKDIQEEYDAEEEGEWDEEEGEECDDYEEEEEQEWEEEDEEEEGEDEEEKEEDEEEEEDDEKEWQDDDEEEEKE
jgi:hypothetical protein